jgi:cytochrome c-type biogenesis protein CcmE
MARPSNSQPLRQHHRITLSLILLLPLLAFSLVPLPVHALSLLEITELLTHPEQYDRQEVVVAGQVTNVQLATNRQGQPAYGFLLKDPAGTLKVISLGQVDVREGDQVIVEGVFSRLRQAGRTIIYNEIKALSIKPMNRLNPDLVG